MLSFSELIQRTLTFSPLQLLCHIERGHSWKQEWEFRQGAFTKREGYYSFRLKIKVAKGGVNAPFN
jgi:hypothetical protein